MPRGRLRSGASCLASGGKRERFGKRRRSGGNNGAGINNTTAEDPKRKKSRSKSDRTGCSLVRNYQCCSSRTRKTETEENAFSNDCSVRSSLPLRSSAIITKSLPYSKDSRGGVDAEGMRVAGGVSATRSGEVGKRFGKHSEAWKTVERTEERKTVAKLLQFFQTAVRPSPTRARLSDLSLANPLLSKEGIFRAIPVAQFSSLFLISPRRSLPVDFIIC